MFWAGDWYCTEAESDILDLVHVRVHARAYSIDLLVFSRALFTRMEKTMEEHLRSNLITIGTIEVLEGEEVFSFTTFSSLREQHFDMLSKKISIGQHALLMKIWEEVWLLHANSSCTYIIRYNIIILYISCLLTLKNYNNKIIII